MKLPSERLGLLSFALFALAAWPLALVDVPPLQDLPNHLATITVLRHPELYPELHANGFLKTNTALFAWLFVSGRALGTHLAAKLFVALVLAANAWVIPRFVAAVTTPRIAAVSCLFAWPLIHNWFVSAGMLNYALAFPMALGVLTLAHRKQPWLACALALATWYAHAFPLIVIGAFTAFHIATRGSWPDRIAAAKGYALPLVPAGALVVASTLAQVGDGPGPMTGYVSHHASLPTWELAYNLWAECLYGFTWLSITSIVPAIGLAYYAVRRARVATPLVSYCVVLGVFIAYLLTPYIATNWFYVSTRLIPFLAVIALTRVPESLPRGVARLLVVCAALYGVGMGVDYVRLDRDRAKVTAGIDAVPEGATLLPLMFRSKETSENTRSILHAWGYYVEAKHTSAPLLFSFSRSFPVTYAAAPPPRFNHLLLENFAPSMGDSRWMCRVLRDGGITIDDCEAAWRERWAEFFRAAEPRFDHLLLWDAPAAVRALLPRSYEPVFEQGKLVILARRASPQ